MRDRIKSSAASINIVSLNHGTLNIPIPAAIGLAGVLITIAVLLTARHVHDWTTLSRSLRLDFLVIAFLAHAVALFAAALSWHRIVTTINGEARLGRDVRLYIVTASARRLPGSLWGSALRLYWYRSLGGDWRPIAVATVIEVMTLTVAGLLLAPIGAVLFIASSGPIRFLILASLCIFIVALRCSSSLSTQIVSSSLRLLKVESADVQLSFGLRPPVTWTALSMVCWVFGGFELSAIVRALTPYNLALVPTIVSMWVIAGVAGSLITFLPGGFGIVDVTLGGLLATIFPIPLAVAAALGMRLITMAFEIFWTGAGVAVPAGVRAVAFRNKSVPDDKT